MKLVRGESAPPLNLLMRKNAENTLARHSLPEGPVLEIAALIESGRVSFEAGPRRTTGEKNG